MNHFSEPQTWGGERIANCAATGAVLVWRTPVFISGGISIFRSLRSTLISMTLTHGDHTIFHCISTPDNSLFSHSALPVLSPPSWSFQLYFSMKVSLSPGIFPSGWLGSRDPLTRQVPLVEDVWSTYSSPGRAVAYPEVVKLSHRRFGCSSPRR